MAVSLQCPSCSASLKLANPVAPGKAVRCPKCQKTFKPTAEAPAAAAKPRPAVAVKAAPAMAVAPVRKADRRDDDDERDEQNVKKSTKKDAPDNAKKGNAALFWSLIIGGGLLLAGGGTAGVLWGMGFFDPKPSVPGWSKKEEDVSEYKKLLVGCWEPDKPAETLAVEFRTDGKVIIATKAFSLAGTYRFLSDREIEVAFSNIDGAIRSWKSKVQMTKDELSLTEDGEKETVFTRVWKPGSISAALVGDWKVHFADKSVELTFTSDGRVFGWPAVGRTVCRVIEGNKIEVRVVGQGQPVTQHEFRIVDDKLTLQGWEKGELCLFRCADDGISLDYDEEEQMHLEAGAMWLKATAIRARPDSPHSPIVGLEFERAQRITADKLKVLGKLKGFRRICFAKTSLTAEDMKLLPELSGVEEVEFREVELSDDALKIVASMPGLRTLRLSYCRGLSGDYAMLDDCPELRHLQVEFSPIEANGIAAISKLARLETLEIFGGESIKPDSIAALAQLKNLRALRTPYLRPNDEVLKKLAALPELVEFRIGTNRLSDKAIQAITAMPKCERLFFQDALRRVDVNLVQQIGGMKRLRQLSIRSYWFEADAFNALLKLENLEYLRLEGCPGITPADLKQLHSLKKLRVLDVLLPNFKAEQIPELQESWPSCKIIGTYP